MNVLVDLLGIAVLIGLGRLVFLIVRDGFGEEDL